MLSGTLSLRLTVLASLGAAGNRFKFWGVPSAFAFLVFAVFSFTRLRKSSRERECRTCSMRTLMRFSRYRLPTCL